VIVNRKADFFYTTNRFESIRDSNRFESRIGMLYLTADTLLLSGRARLVTCIYTDFDALKTTENSTYRNSRIYSAVYV